MFRVAMLFPACAGFLVAAWLLWRARKQGICSLGGFCIMRPFVIGSMSVLFQGYEKMGITLFCANPLMRRFLHFPFFVIRVRRKRVCSDRCCIAIPLFFTPPVVAGLLQKLGGWGGERIGT